MFYVVDQRIEEGKIRRSGGGLYLNEEQVEATIKVRLASKRYNLPQDSEVVVYRLEEMKRVYAGKIDTMDSK
jgi:hypothetical protein